MSFYLARLEAARQQHRMMAAAAAAGHAHAPRAWPPYSHHAVLLPRPQLHPPAPPPLHAGGIRVLDTWHGGSVPRRDDGARGGVSAGSASATGATPTRAWEETGGEEMRNKRPLAPTTPRPRSPSPKRRAVAAAAAARRLFPPGCGRDAALPLASADGDGDGDASRSVAARGDGTSGAPHESAPPPRPALAVGKVDSVLFEATPSPSAAAASAGGGSTWISGLEKVSASGGAAGVLTDDGGHHCRGEMLVKSSEALGTPNGVAAAATAGALTDAADSQGVEVEGPGSGRLLDCQVSSSVTLHEATACVVEAYASHTSCGERIGNRWHCEGRRSSAVPAIDANDATSKLDGTSCNVVAAESLAQGLPKGGHWSDNVSECAALNTTCSDDFAARVSGEGAAVRKRVMHTPRKSVKPPRLIQKSLLDTQRRPSSMAIERETELIGRSVPMNGSQDTGVFTKDRAIEDPMSAKKFPWTNGNEAAFFGPKKRVSKKKLKNRKRVTVKGPTASACAFDDKEDSILEDDEILKALSAHETKFEFRPQSTDPRSKVKLICSRFETICRAIVQSAEHRSVKVRRVDLAADKLMRKLPGFTKQGPVVGSVPGVEVGDEFLYRVQLALVGLHRPFQGGIDATSHEKTGVRIAISVVASGGYPDELSSSSGELVYTGSGKKDHGDQKLEHGNLALKNCIEMKTPVRVIHGFRDQNREEGSHSRAREISTFTYDGLYRVVDCWREGSPGSKVFKYKLQRIPGQPQLSIHMAKASKLKWCN